MDFKKRSIFYTEIDNKNAVTIRFHQQWINEKYYYDILATFDEFDFDEL